MPVEPYKRLSTIYKSAQVQNHSAEMFLAMAILSPTNQEHGKNNLNLKVKLEKYFRNKVKSPSFRKAINGLRLRSKFTFFSSSPSESSESSMSLNKVGSLSIF